MTIILRKLLIQLGVLAVLGAIPLTSYADLIVKNISSYTGAGRWDWTIFVEADSRSLQQIKCVEYHLHPTFSEPVRKVCNQPETKFAYSTNGWGTFTVKVNILFKDGHSQELEHPLVFEQKPKLVPLNVIPNNWWQEIEPGWWKWGIYIDGTPTELDQIRCVEYSSPDLSKPGSCGLLPTKPISTCCSGLGNIHCEDQTFAQRWLHASNVSPAQISLTLQYRLWPRQGAKKLFYE